MVTNSSSNLVERIQWKSFPLVALLTLTLVMSGCASSAPATWSDEPWCVENAEDVASYVASWNESEPGRKFSRDNGFNLSIFDFPAPRPVYSDHSECFPAPIRAWFEAGQPVE